MLTPQEIWARVAQARPTVHAITNPVTVNDCANIILAAWGAPTMAQDVREVEEIQAQADALVLNLGAPQAEDAMLLAGKKAAALGHPIVLDPVAAGASALRGALGRRILDALPCAVIRGNASEIRALALGGGATRGVEASPLDRVTNENLDATLEMLTAFSRETGAAVVMSGEIDLIVCDGRAAVVHGGSALMARITGAGCMLTALTGTLAGANPQDPFGAAVTAVAAMNCCGELAAQRVSEMQEGTASFRTRLIDAVSCLDPVFLARHAQITYR